MAKSTSIINLRKDGYNIAPEGMLDKITNALCALDNKYINDGLDMHEDYEYLLREVAFQSGFEYCDSDKWKSMKNSQTWIIPINELLIISTCGKDIARRLSDKIRLIMIGRRPDLNAAIKQFIRRSYRLNSTDALI